MAAPSIQEHVDQGSSWVRCEDGYTVKHTGESYRGEYLVAPTELTEFDTQLGGLIDFLYDFWTTTHNFRYLPGDVVRSTMLHWGGKSNPTVQVDGVDRYVEMVTYFPGSQDDTDKHTIFMSYEMTQSYVPGSDRLGFVDNLVNHVSAIGMTEVALSQKWLDTNYPKWNNRYAAGKAMGLSDWAMAIFVFDKVDTTPDIDLDAVTFS